MSEPSKPPSSSLGFPFWVGYVVSTVGCIILLAKLDMLVVEDWTILVLLSAVFGVLAPTGGLILQAAHDLSLMVLRGQLRLWQLVLLLAIMMACLALGYIYHLNGAPPWPWFVW